MQRLQGKVCSSSPVKGTVHYVGGGGEGAAFRGRVVSPEAHISTDQEVEIGQKATLDTQ